MRAALLSRGVIFAIDRVERDLPGDLGASGLTERIGADRRPIGGRGDDLVP
ncbi:hypothetical protein [Nocardia fluminea]|uniref:hypothetical protein n=1 Tax=Nocardia fluminea TaxID=134984 RepID=UPI003D0AE29D